MREVREGVRGREDVEGVQVRQVHQVQSVHQVLQVDHLDLKVNQGLSVLRDPKVNQVLKVPLESRVRLEFLVSLVQLGLPVR